MKRVVCNALEDEAGPLLAGLIRQTIAETGRCRIALSGGSTPAPTFAWLGRNLEPALYEGLWVTWADERQLPVVAAEPWWAGWSDQSNLRLAFESWLWMAPRIGKVLPLCDGSALEARAAEVGRLFEREWGGLDVVQLGVGPDGHVASLFPGHPALEQPGPVLAVRDSPKPPPERLSLSLSAIEQAAHVVVMARGANKAPVLERAFNGDAEIPLGRLRPRGSWTWIVDEAAASGLGEDG